MSLGPRIPADQVDPIYHGLIPNYSSLCLWSFKKKFDWCFEPHQRSLSSYSHVIEEDIIGVQDDVRILMLCLVDPNKGHRVVAICGMRASKQEEMPSYGVFPEYRDHPDGPPITKEISRIGHGPLRPESNEVELLLMLNQFFSPTCVTNLIAERSNQ
ncbi:hypothetical protein JHK87_049246 [Glycine soja]|nr:hypothetical protein JHK87_049246 [Glycine soja]